MKKKIPKHEEVYDIDEQIEYLKRIRKTTRARFRPEMISSIEQTLIAAKWLVYCQLRRLEPEVGNISNRR